MTRRLLLSGILLAWSLVIALPSPAAPPAASVAGAWDLHVDYIHGTGKHRMTIQQQDGTLTGTYRSQQGTEVPLEGSVSDNTITIQVRMRHEASRFTYDFTGEVSGDTMKGTVDLGEYWTATWTAARAKRTK